jgi:hypothetical protein
MRWSLARSSSSASSPFGKIMSTGDFRFWQFVWFFSMDESAQESLIGRVNEQWFIEEDQENAGANYLMGVCLAFFEISPHSLGETLEPAAHALRHTVVRLADELRPEQWAFRTLAKSEGWLTARQMATALIAESKTTVRPPRKPFKIEEIIHVDHYQHASRLRQMSVGRGR